MPPVSPTTNMLEPSHDEARGSYDCVKQIRRASGQAGHHDTEGRKHQGEIARQGYGRAEGHGGVACELAGQAKQGKGEES